MIRISNIKVPVGAGDNILHKKIANIIKTELFSVEKIVKRSIEINEAKKKRIEKKRR